VNDTRELLRRGLEGFEPMPDAFERVLVRRDRKRRNQRIMAGALAFAVVVAGILVFMASLRSQRVPADPDIAPENSRPVFERTTTVGGLTVTSPSDWSLVDYWGDWNPDAISLDGNAIPLLELTNFDPGLSTPVCDAASGEPTRLPADGVAIFVKVGDDGSDVADLCGGSIEVSAAGTVGPYAYRSVMRVGPDVTEESRAAAIEIWRSMAWNDLTFYTRANPPGYVLDGWEDGEETWLLEARPSERNVDLSTTGITSISMEGNTVANVGVPRPNAVEGETFGAVTEDAARVELHRAGIDTPFVARLIDLPPSLSFEFDAFVFEPEPRGGPFEVVAIGADGEVLGSNLPPLVDTERVGTVRAFGSTWTVKISTAADGFWASSCVEPAATGTLSPCERGPGGGMLVQSSDGPSASVFVTQAVGDIVGAIDVQADDGTVFHAVMLPVRHQGSDAGWAAVVALEGGGRGRFVYHLTDGSTDEGRRPEAHVEWQDLGQVIGEGSFPAPGNA
jgi:hypothetical protein